jgi:hypothetical protein
MQRILVRESMYLRRTLSTSVEPAVEIKIKKCWIYSVVLNGRGPI